MSTDPHRTVANGDYDAAIIGGGLVGLAIAYGMSRAGARVVILDEGDVAYRASRGNFGLVWVQGKGVGKGAYSNWTQGSAREWPRLARLLREDTDIDVMLEQPGGFQVCLSHAEMQAKLDSMAALMAQQDVERYDYQVCDPADLRAALPGLGPDVVGGVYTRLDGHVNPLRLFRALLLGAQAYQAAYRPMAPVSRVDPCADGFAVQTPGGAVRTSRVVLAAGLANAQLAPALGMNVPVRPQRGQILVMERMPRFMSYPIVTLRQTDEGTVLIGDSLEEAGFDDRVGLPVLATLAERATRIFPALESARVVRTWAALRVMSPDGFPVYAQSSTLPGAFAATCHSGVTLAAAHALLLAPSILAGKLPGALAPFSMDRFNV
ncbi:NAD(P)/FAD-dependent oxidoreductase [Paraburkholderia sp.]|uniref:NAD(P)/FAD-dependent oxidoreductase n=1 Tax=Paraburkholderia sp. TaxID=1926495 RepID=UPI0039E2268D